MEDAAYFFPFKGWSWLIATKLDKDTRFHRWNPNAWNSVHLAAGVPYPITEDLFVVTRDA